MHKYLNLHKYLKLHKTRLKWNFYIIFTSLRGLGRQPILLREASQFKLIKLIYIYEVIFYLTSLKLVNASLINSSRTPLWLSEMIELRPFRIWITLNQGLSSHHFTFISSVVKSYKSQSVYSLIQCNGPTRVTISFWRVRV